MRSLWSNWQYGNIASDNGLVPNRQQAIMWRNLGMFYSAYMHHSVLMN